MTDCIILARPQPFGDWVRAVVPAGKTIRQLLGDAAYSAKVSIGGHDVPEQLWDRVKPKPGTEIRIIVFPQGGNGGKILRVVAMVALAYVTAGIASGAIATAATGTTYGFISAGALSAIVGVVGTMAINALIPPPGLSSAGGMAQQDPFNQLASLTGTSNQANPYGVIPCVIGASRMFPPMAALPYTEVLGDQQYLRMLLDCGHGDLDISDIQIGGTPIDTYGDVEYEIGVSPSLFTQDVYELAVGQPLNSTGSNQTRTTQSPTDEGSVDLSFPAGLFAVDAQGKTVSGTVDVYIQYRAVGDTTWIDASGASGLSLSSSAIVVKSGSTDFQITGGARKLLRVGVRWKFPAAGVYEVRVGRDTSAWAGTIVQGFRDMQWDVLRSIAYRPASSTGTTKLAIRAKATGDMSGVVSSVSVMAAQKVRRWDAEAGAWLTPVATQNPAWVALWMQTQCPATVRRLDDSRMNVDDYARWAAECEDKDYRVSHVADGARPFGDVLRDVFACGRAAHAVRNGKYSVTRDVAQTIPAQTFTAENSWGFGYSRSFLPPPHALRVKFRNPSANYQEDTRTVYWDGYSDANATRFEDLDLRMVDDADAVWRLARYHLAVMWLRPTQYVLNADFENLVCETGDLVHVGHELTGWGVSTGRLRSVSGTTVVLSGPVTLEAGKSYKLQVRNSFNERHDAAITTAAGTHTTLTLDASLDAAEGDLFAVGEVAKGLAALIVRKITRSGDTEAQLTLVDAAPSVLDADAGTPPAFTSEITGQPWCAPPDPPVVHVRAGDSAPDDAGVIHAAPGVSAPPASGIYRVRNPKYQEPL